jgi:polar amino acid transport system permease protein
MTIDFSVIEPYIGVFARAAVVTAMVSLIAFGASAVLAALLLPMRVAKSKVARATIGTYIELMRNLPILLVLYVVYYGLPTLGVPMGAFVAAIVALALNSTAYMIEIYRGGLNAIPIGHTEAAQSLGLRKPTVWRNIYLPQAIKYSFPAIGNQLVACVLGSSLAMLIGTKELTNAATVVGSASFRYFETFIIVALIYIMLSQFITFVWTRLYAVSFGRKYGV